MQVIRPVSIAFELTIGVVIAGATSFIGLQFMPGDGIWLGIVPLVITVFVAGRTPVRRWHAVRQGFPRHWQAWLSTHVPYYEQLSASCRRRFERDIQIFLSEQNIEGIAGVSVKETHQLAIAAAAAMLLNGRPAWELPKNHSFLLYPANFNEDYLLEDDRTDADLLGRAHGQGPVILSMPAVHEAIRDPEDGRNVILHEITHLLDFANLPAASAAATDDGLSRRELTRLLDEEMEKIDRGTSLLGSYAGTNPAEFLAVATERFFEGSEVFERKHPRLYHLLCTIYNQNPNDRSETCP